MSEEKEDEGSTEPARPTLILPDDSAPQEPRRRSTVVWTSPVVVDDGDGHLAQRKFSRISEEDGSGWARLQVDAPGQPESTLHRRSTVKPSAEYLRDVQRFSRIVSVVQGRTLESRLANMEYVQTRLAHIPKLTFSSWPQPVALATCTQTL
ncbi:Dynein heavy chain 5, axonemal [Branchiostoma belcheri]|nr:Dynein heavy chain 5, axonemal [Branchiostoma belcheri]